MSDCASGYTAYILELAESANQTCTDPVILIEQRVDFSRWVESGFGTADCIIIADGTLQICDYKHGLGIVVNAEKILSCNAMHLVCWSYSMEFTILRPLV